MRSNRKGARMVPAGFFHKFKMRRLARLYAVRLPGLLVQDYGAGETYNDAQITACARRAKLPEAGLLLARAAFLPEVEFTQKYGANYAELHQLFKSSIPLIPSAPHSGTASGGAQVPLGWSP
jgi:hypothetical protein